MIMKWIFLYTLLYLLLVPNYLTYANNLEEDVSFATTADLPLKVETFYDNLFFVSQRIETKMKNGESHVGTGFIVRHRISKDKAVFLLVSNRHIFENAAKAQFFLLKKENDQPKYGEKLLVNLENLDKIVFFHPNPSVDVALVNISKAIDIFNKRKKEFFIRTIIPSDLLSPDEIQTYDSVEEVIFVGYPSGMYDEYNYVPIVRRGTSATPIMLDYNGQPEFLIDASVFPGSSGSPVFIAPSIGSIQRKGKERANHRRVALLGIISRVAIRKSAGDIKFVEIPSLYKPMVEYEQMIDLGVVVKAKAIKYAIQEYLTKYDLPLEDLEESVVDPEIME